MSRRRTSLDREIDVISREREELKQNIKNRKRGKRAIAIRKFFIFCFVLAIICCYTRFIFIVWTI